MTIGKKSGFIWGMLILQEHMLILSWLIHFCTNYDPSSAANEYGIPLVEEYNSTPSIAGTYPGRSTLEETYKQIDSDLAKAEEYVTTAGEINSAYITADVVKALKARIALEKEDYQTAISTATALVNSGTYPIDDGWRCLCRYVVA